MKLNTAIKLFSTAAIMLTSSLTPAMADIDTSTEYYGVGTHAEFVDFCKDNLVRCFNVKRYTKKGDVWFGFSFYIDGGPRPMPERCETKNCK